MKARAVLPSPSPIVEDGCGSPVPVVTFHMPPPHEPSETPQHGSPVSRAQTTSPLPRAQTVPPTPHPNATPNYHPTGSPGVPEATPC
jgi:hypothetical protein